MSDDLFRGLKAILKTALTWGFLLGATVAVIAIPLIFLYPGGGDHTFPERVGSALFAGVGFALRFAVAGGILGTLFATTVRLSFRGRRLADLSIGRFALIGGVVGAVGIPVVYQLLNVLSGGAIPWSLLIDDAPWAAVVGASAAAGSIWMARRAAALPGEKELDRLGEPNALDKVPMTREGAEVRRPPSA
jgi:hypothetical protein